MNGRGKGRISKGNDNRWTESLEGISKRGYVEIGGDMSND